jgi:hypothetical protein
MRAGLCSRSLIPEALVITWTLQVQPPGRERWRVRRGCLYKQAAQAPADCESVRVSLRRN